MKIIERKYKHYLVKLTREELDLIGAMTKVFVRNAPPTIDINPSIARAKDMSNDIYKVLSKDKKWKEINEI